MTKPFQPKPPQPELMSLTLDATSQTKHPSTWRELESSILGCPGWHGPGIAAFGYQAADGMNMNPEEENPG